MMAIDVKFMTQSMEEREAKDCVSNWITIGDCEL